VEERCMMALLAKEKRGRRAGGAQHAELLQLV
jgi:hypothetical protein